MKPWKILVLLLALALCACGREGAEPASAPEAPRPQADAQPPSWEQLAWDRRLAIDYAQSFSAEFA